MDHEIDDSGAANMLFRDDKGMKLILYKEHELCLCLKSPTLCDRTETAGATENTASLPVQLELHHYTENTDSLLVQLELHHYTENTDSLSVQLELHHYTTRKGTCSRQDIIDSAKLNNTLTNWIQLTFIGCFMQPQNNTHSSQTCMGH